MTLVEGTNDYSIVSKLSAASAGYFKDEFLVDFVDRRKRRAPLINWGYFLRFKSLELTFENIVRSLSAREEPFQILSVGAGFDTTFFNVMTKCASEGKFKFFEIDLPSNVERKSRLIQKSESCRKLLICPKFTPQGIESDHFTLFACDLANQVELEQKLKCHKFNFGTPTVILSECVLTYMETRDSDNLIKFLAEKITHAAFVVYEQIRPCDAFGKFMVSHFKKIGSSIKGVHDYPSHQDQKKRYLESGWEKSNVITLAQVLLEIVSTEDLQELRKLELFDEYEELVLKSSHYIVVYSSKGNLNAMLPQNTNMDYGDVAELTSGPLCSGHLVTITHGPDSFHLNRFGHATAAAGDKIYCWGGFGEAGARASAHQRLDQLLTLDTASGEVTVTSGAAASCMYSAAAADTAAHKLYFVGGRSSPQRGRDSVLQLDLGTGALEDTGWRLPGGGAWRLGAAVLGHHLVCVGGLGAGGGEVTALDTRTGSWVQPRSLDTALHSVSCALWSRAGRVVVSGGLHSHALCSGAVFTVAVLGGELEVTQLEVTIHPRFSHTSHVVGDQLIVVGGVGLGDPPPCEVIHLVTGARTWFQLPSEVGGGLLMCHGHGSAMVSNQLWILGGGGNCFSFGTHYNRTFKFDISKYLE